MKEDVCSLALLFALPLAGCYGMHAGTHGIFTWASVAVVFYAAFLTAMDYMCNYDYKEDAHAHTNY